MVWNTKISNIFKMVIMVRGQKYTKEQAIKLVSDCYDNEEPVFIIRGKDKVASKAIKAYAEMVKDSVGPEKAETPTYILAEQAELVAVDVLVWQGIHMDEIKLPD